MIRMGLPIRRIRLRRGDHHRLEKLVGRRATAQRVVERAAIVLSSAKGMSGAAICAQVGVSRPTVTQWLDRYEAEGIEALLGDRQRSGRCRRSGAAPRSPSTRSACAESGLSYEATRAMIAFVPLADRRASTRGSASRHGSGPRAPRCRSSHPLASQRPSAAGSDRRGDPTS